MSGEDRYPHAGAAHRLVADANNFAALVAELLLFVGLKAAVVDVAARIRQDVERDWLGELRRWRELDGAAVEREASGAVDHLARLLIEFVDPGQPGAGH